MVYKVVGINIDKKYVAQNTVNLQKIRQFVLIRICFRTSKKPFPYTQLCCFRINYYHVEASSSVCYTCFVEKFNSTWIVPPSRKITDSL
jgi:hypothetical protein